MRRAMRLAFLLCCAASVARAQDTELPLDRLTPAIVSQLVDSSIVSAARYRDSLLAVRGRRTVQNTLRLYDEISIRFNTAQIVHFLSRMHPDSAVRAAAAEGVRRRDAFSTSLDLDPRIYRALRAVDTTRADTETRYYLRRVLAQYHHDGVDRDSSTRARVAALRDEATRLAQRFTENLRQDTASLTLPDTGALRGLPADWVSAQRRGPAGEVLVAPADLRFVLQNADDPGVRQRVQLRITNLAPQNHFVVDSLLHVREQIATLLGFPSYAAFQLHDCMAGTPSEVHQFLDEVQRISEPGVQRDLASAESLLGRPPVAGDVQYVIYHLQRRSGAGPNVLRPYFPYERVRDALLHIADTLVGLQFTAAPDLPVWHSDVEAYRVMENGKLIGIAYLDLRRRPGKPTAEATGFFRVGVRGRVLPRSVVTLSLPQARLGEPVLLGPQAVGSLFHEFGHLLESLIAVRPWFGTSGLPAEFDFREIPSIVFERWGRDPTVLKSFARHYRTGDALPDSLVSALRQSDETRVALGVRGLLARGRISLALHERPGGMGEIDSIVQTQLRASIPVARAAGESHQEASFTHLVGYEAAYYTYLWDAVIAEDVLGQFKSGLLDPVTVRAYRRAILEPGRSQPAEKSIEAFLRRPFTMDAWARTLAP